MKKRNLKSTGIGLSILLSATALLILQLSGGGRLTATDSDDPMGQAVVSSGVIAEHPPVEIVEKRDDHTRIWEIVREVETTHPDGSVTVDTVKSYIHEKASGLCYKDATGNYVPSVAEWRETADGFVIDRCAYRLAMGKTVGAPARYTVEGNDLLLRPAYLIISDGVNHADLATLNPETPGSICPDNPSILRFPSAFGEGYDLEYVAEKGGFHQNLVIANPPRLPDGFHPENTSVHLYTELNLDQYVAASGCEVAVEGESVDAAAPDLVTEPSGGGCISFTKDGRLLHAFSVSSVTDSSGPGALDKQTTAEKRLMKDPASGKAYLVESVLLSYFTERAPTYPMTWDYESKSGSIGTQTWEPRYTYRITGNVTVSGTLTILPGTTVKLDPSKKITMAIGGKVIAKGEPHNYITFTKSSDSNCGEPIPGAPAGGWDKVLDIASDSSYGSIIQYCKFGHGSIALNIRMSPGDAVAHNVFNDMNCAIQMQCASVTVHNNVMTNCVYYNIYSTYVYEPIYTNNTIHGTSVGIYDYGSCYFRATDNLFSNCSTGIFVGNYYSCEVHHNRYYNVPTFLSGASGYNNLQLQSWPYSYSAIGSYFLNPANGEYEQKLKDNGSRTPSDAGLSESFFTVLAPTTISQSQYTSAVTWPQIQHDTGGWVDIGYHHCRTDIYLESGLTVSGPSGVLTIEPGVVVAIRGDKYLKASNQGGKLLSVGDPSAGGFNIITCSKSLSMNIESPRFADTSTNPYVWIYGDASAESKIQFTRTMWLGWGVWLLRDLDEPIRDNVFCLSYYGIHASVNYCQNRLVNDLFHHNYYGAHVIGGTQGKAGVCNCTFDWNATGLKAQVVIGGVLPIRDSLFTRNDAEGIWMDCGSGEIVNYCNAFWENGVPITGGSPGPGSLELSESPYFAAIETGWQLCYKLKQDEGWPFANSPINAGSCWAPDPVDGPHPYSTCDYAKRDVGRIDMGFHFTFYDNTDPDSLPDAWEMHYFGDLDEGDSSPATDNDGLSAVQEFWHGSDPTEDDTDGDGYNDADEVGPRQAVEASRKLCRGWGPAVYDFKAGPWLTNLTWSQQALWGVTIGWWVSQTAADPLLYYKSESELTFDQIQLQIPLDVRDHSIEGKVFEKRLEGLLAGTTYQYYVTCTVGGSDKASPLCKFRTLESSPSSFSFIAYGDSRSCPDGDDRHMPGHNNNGFNEYTAQVARGILSKVPGAAFLLHVGDYPENQAGGATTAEHWRQHFFLPSTRLLAEHPLFAALGNHEDGAGLKYFQDFFDYPGDLNPDDPSGVLVRYNFDYANCRFISLDTNNPATFPDQKNNFLIPLLQAAGGKRVFVWFHHPPFSSGPNGSGSPSTDVKDTFVSVFQQYAAKMVFGGHDHIYERAVCTEQGNTVRYIVTGGAGAPLSTGVEGYHYPSPDHGAVQEKLYDRSDEPQQDAFHFCVLQVTPSSFNLKAYKWDGTQKDYWP